MNPVILAPSSATASSSLTWADDGIAWQAPGHPLRWHGLHFVAELDDRRRLDSREAALTRHVVGEQAGRPLHRFHLRWAEGRAYLGELAIELSGAAMVWSLRLWPEDGQAWSLRRIEGVCGEVRGWRDLDAARVFHGDNLRGASRGRTIFDAAYFVPLSELKHPLNASRWQSFPGLWIHEPGSPHGLVSGVLAQRAWRHHQTLRALDRRRLQWQGLFFPPGIDARPFAAGEVYESEPLWMESVEAAAPAEALGRYVDRLAERLRPAKATSPLREGFYWGSWNDRRPHFWDVSAALVDRNSALMARLFPAAAAIEIDDAIDRAGGEMVPAVRTTWTDVEGAEAAETQTVAQVRRRLGIGIFFEPDCAVDRSRFPDGMEPVTKQVRERGLLPALWVGLHIAQRSQIVEQRPQWFARYDADRSRDPELAGLFTAAAPGNPAVLDPSLDEVRRYIEQALDTVTRRWGFGSIKLDFWSYAFEDDAFRLAHGSRTALEWRRWLLEAFRSRLPERAFFTLGCDISTGNPFLGEYADNLRYGVDVSNGRWDYLRNVATVGTFLLHCQAYRFFILNPDSVGCFERLGESERRVLWAYSAATRSLCELAGDLARQPRAALRPLEKLLLAPKNGRPVGLGELAHLETDEPASIFWSEGDNFARIEGSAHLPRRLVGVFNWRDEPTEILVDPAMLQLPADASLWDADFFSPEDIASRQGRWRVALPPRSVRLSHVSLAGDAPVVLDSDLRVDAVAWTDQKLMLSLHGTGEAGLTVAWPRSHAPRVVRASRPADLRPLREGLYRLALNCGEVPEAVEVQVEAVGRG